jgi:hypothetical protein
MVLDRRRGSALSCRQMLSVLSHRYFDLGSEQFACFQAMNADVRAVCEHELRCAEVVELLFAAFVDSTAVRWRSAVHAIDQLTDDASFTASKDAQFRLRQFVAENADLLTSQ